MNRKRKSTRATWDREIMIPDVAGLGKDQTVKQRMALMTKHRFLHIPVFKDEKPISIISIGDAAKSIFAEPEFILDQ